MARPLAVVVAVIFAVVALFLGGCVAPHVLLPAKGQGLDELGAGERTIDAHVADSRAGPARVVRVGADADAPVVVVATDASMVSGSTRLDLGLLAEQLCAAGFETLIVDYPARDGSTKRGFERLPAARQRAAARLVADLVGERPVVVRGISLGTTFVARLVEAGVDVRGAVLVAPITPTRLVKAAAREILGFPLGDVAAWLHATPQLHAPVELTDMPLHVVIARDDPFLSARDLERLRTRGAPWTIVESERGHELTAFLARSLGPGEIEFLAAHAGLEARVLRERFATAAAAHLNEKGRAWVDAWLDDPHTTDSDLAAFVGHLHAELTDQVDVSGTFPLRPSDLGDAADWWRDQWRMATVIAASDFFRLVGLYGPLFETEPGINAEENFGYNEYHGGGFFEERLALRLDYEALRQRVTALHGDDSRAWVVWGFTTLVGFDAEVDAAGVTMHMGERTFPTVPFGASAGPRELVAGEVSSDGPDTGRGGPRSW
jgi:predicted alpha/beta hydrolase family esterase